LEFGNKIQAGGQANGQWLVAARDAARRDVLGALVRPRAGARGRRLRPGARGRPGGRTPRAAAGAASRRRQALDK